MPKLHSKFVPHFSVQSTSPSFVGSRGASSPLYCERLSPWVLQKELRSVMSESSKRDDFLQPEWREKEARNATIWWNLVVSFMRYRLPISFLSQGNFQTRLIAPTPSYEESSLSQSLFLGRTTAYSYLKYYHEGLKIMNSCM
jgi:hypothetical protein